MNNIEEGNNKDQNFKEVVNDLLKQYIKKLRIQYRKIEDYLSKKNDIDEIQSAKYITEQLTQECEYIYGIINEINRKISDHSIPIKQLNNDVEKDFSLNMLGIKPILGIDLGTSRSTVGYYRINKRGREEIEIVANSEGFRSNPSVICIIKGKTYFGREAEKMSLKYPQNLIYDTKRMLGRKFDDPFIQEARKYWEFETIKSEEGGILIKVEDKLYEPYEISGMILEFLMKLANSHLSEKTNQAIITIPSYFDGNQRDDTLKAANYAHIKIIDLIEEPIAATICYRCDHDEIKDKSQNVLVYDFGGGTLDVSYVQIDDNNFNIISISGNPHLGGQNITNVLFDYVSQKIDGICTKEWRKNSRFINYIRKQCEEAKINLSGSEEIDMYLDIPSQLIKNKKSEIDDNIKITRKELESILNKLFDKFMLPVNKILEDSQQYHKLKKDDPLIKGLILVGGSSYIPMIKNELEKKCKTKSYHGVCAVEAVSYGACIYAGSYIQKKLIQKDKSCIQLNPFLTNMAVKRFSDRSIIIKKIKYGKSYSYPIINQFTKLPFEVEIKMDLKEIETKNKTGIIIVFECKKSKLKQLGNIQFMIQKSAKDVSIFFLLDTNSLFYSIFDIDKNEYNEYQLLSTINPEW